LPSASSELREPPRVQVEGPDSDGRFRASHRRVTAASAEGQKSTVCDVVVLGPWRREETQAKRDSERFRYAFERHGQDGLMDALVQVEANPTLGARGWNVEIENSDDGSRRCRAICRFEGVNQRRPEVVSGPQRPSRVRAEEDAMFICEAFRRGGLDAARQAATDPGQHRGPEVAAVQPCTTIRPNLVPAMHTKGKGGCGARANGFGCGAGPQNGVWPLERPPGLFANGPLQHQVRGGTAPPPLQPPGLGGDVRRPLAMPPGGAGRLNSFVPRPGKGAPFGPGGAAPLQLGAGPRPLDRNDSVRPSLVVPANWSGAGAGSAASSKVRGSWINEAAPGGGKAGEARLGTFGRMPKASAPARQPWSKPSAEASSEKQELDPGAPPQTHEGQKEEKGPAEQQEDAQAAPHDGEAPQSWEDEEEALEAKKQKGEVGASAGRAVGPLKQVSKAAAGRPTSSESWEADGGQDAGNGRRQNPPLATPLSGGRNTPRPSTQGSGGDPPWRRKQQPNQSARSPWAPAARNAPSAKAEASMIRLPRPKFRPVAFPSGVASARRASLLNSAPRGRASNDAAPPFRRVLSKFNSTAGGRLLNPLKSRPAKVSAAVPARPALRQGKVAAGAAGEGIRRRLGVGIGRKSSASAAGARGAGGDQGRAASSVGRREAAGDVSSAKAASGGGKSSRADSKTKAPSEGIGNVWSLLA